jgi:hypothetical protein
MIYPDWLLNSGMVAVYENPPPDVSGLSYASRVQEISSLFYVVENRTVEVQDLAYS